MAAVICALGAFQLWAKPAVNVASGSSVREPSRGLRFFEDDQSEGGRLGKLWRREDLYELARATMRMIEGKELGLGGS